LVLAVGLTFALTVDLGTAIAERFETPWLKMRLDGVVKRVLLTTFPVRVFVVFVAAGFGAGLEDGFGATFATGFTAAFGATLVDATFAGAAFTGVPTVTLLTCFAFVTCSPPLPL
jgi:hypothetical protein